VGPITGLENVERRKILPFLGLEIRPLGCPAGSQSLYRLRYPVPKSGSSKGREWRIREIKKQECAIKTKNKSKNVKK
jgi:hypothetical protein